MTKQTQESPIVADEILSALMSFGEDPTNDRIDAIAKYVDPTAEIAGDRASSVKAIVDDVRRFLQVKDGRFRAPESRTIQSGKSLLDDALALTGGSRSQWVPKNEGTWEYCNVALSGVQHPLRVGVSTGGVVSINGDPFTPDAKRTMNVNLEAVVTSLTLSHQRALKFDPAVESAGGKVPAAAETVDGLDKGKSSFKPTRAMVEAAENLLFAMAFRDTVSPIVVDYQTRILGEGKWTVRDEFADESSGKVGDGRAMTPELITDPGRAWLMSDSNFAIYDGRCQAAARDAGLKVAREGNCPKLVAEEDVRLAERGLIDAMAPFTNLPARIVVGFPTKDYNRFVGRTLDELTPFVDVDRMKARMAVLRDGQDIASESPSM